MIEINKNPLWNILFNLMLKDSVSEVETNGPDSIWIKESGKRKKVDAPELSLNEYFESIEEGLVPYVKSQNTYNRENFIFEGRLEYEYNGKQVKGRCHVVLPPATDTPQVTIAKKTTSLLELEGLAEGGSMTPEMKEFIKACVRAGRTIVFSGSTGAGKALSLDTKIPTPTGFTTMGKIRIGDKIFDRFGNTTTVTNKFPQPKKQVYEIKLETGEKIKCDAEHNWIVSTTQTKNKLTNKTKTNQHEIYTVKTTQEILQNFHKEIFNTPKLSQPIEYTHNKETKNGLKTKELPINPYLLGLWITDEKNNKKTTQKLYNDSQKIEPTTTNYDNFKKTLQNLELLNQNNEKTIEKIPTIYLRSSIEARKLLLAGLIDGNNSEIANNFITFTNNNETILQNFNELASSLGFKPQYRKTDNDNTILFPCFENISLIKEKHNTFAGEELTFDRERRITNVYPLENVFEEMACITVDSQDSSYLITESFIPTHNTTMLEAAAKLIDNKYRIGVAEDTPELILPQENVTYLHSTPWAPGMDPNRVATLDWVVAQFMRNRVDKLIIGETRGKEFAGFLTASNSGIEGNLTTIHGETPVDCLRKMSNFTVEGRPGVPVRSINADISTAIDIIIQLIILPNGGHRVSHIQEITRTLGTREDSQITTQTLYAYDRATDSFYKKSNMTDDLRERFAERNVDISSFLQSPSNKKIKASGYVVKDDGNVIHENNGGVFIPNNGNAGKKQKRTTIPTSNPFKRNI